MSEEIQELLDIVARLEPDARALVLMTARRLMVGQRQYGRLDIATDRRDFVAEAIEEAVDMNTYLLIALRRVQAVTS